MEGKVFLGWILLFLFLKIKIKGSTIINIGAKNTNRNFSKKLLIVTSKKSFKICFGSLRNVYKARATKK